MPRKTNFISYYLDYFEELATQSESINSFIRMNPDEFSDAARSDLVYPVMVMERLESSIDVNGASSQNRSISWAFSILYDIDARGADPYDQEEAAQNNAWVIIRAIISRIMRDSAQSKKTADRLIPVFYPGTIRTYPTAMVFEGCKGIYIEGEFMEQVDFSFDADEWKDVT